MAAVELDKTKKSSDRLGDSVRGIGAGGRGGLRNLAELPPASERVVRGLSFTRQAIISAIAAGAALAPTFVEAGAGVAAFGALAVPTIAKVIKAQTEMGDEWESLTTDQKIAAVSTQSLVQEYKDLSATLAPDTLRLYNAALTETRELLPELVPLSRSVTTALTDAVNALGDGFDSDQAQQFFDFLKSSPPGAIDGIVSIAQEGGAAAASFIQALSPLAPVVGGLVSGVLQLVGGVAELLPELLQLVVTAVALKGLVSAVSDVLSSTATRTRTFVRETKNASLAQKLLTAAASAGPNIYLAGAAALGVLVVSLAAAKTKGDELVDSIQAQNLAIRNNVAGYENANRILAAKVAPVQERIGQAIRDRNADLNVNTVALAQGALAQRGLNDETTAAYAALEANRRALSNINAGAQAVASTYGITTQQAIALADAVGVDLSKGIVESGNLTAAAAGKFAAYQAAVQAAQNPTLAIQSAFAGTANEALNLYDRVKALQTAFDLTINPSLALFTATTRVRDAVAAANKVLQDGDASSQARRTSLQNLIGTLRDQANAEFTANQNVNLTKAAYDRQLPTLLALAGRSREARDLIRDLGGALTGAKRAADEAGDSLGTAGQGRATRRPG
ncbi:hypothetical protein ACIBKY_49755 [Nonomuraea sp. NPDC050394]|uniref:hypothetical protein n=1 Tax=Nonomuraea sp. NPDC050394 TaxID=3364363 RepID=UPI0037B480FA